MRRVLALVASILVIVASAGAIPASAAEGEIEHCTLEVIGRNKDGSFATGRLKCAPAPAIAGRGFAAMSSSIAIHYDDPNMGGSSLTILGGACTGGWLNLPAAWQDRIESTRSHCEARHYRDNNLSGPMNPTYSPGGNLTTVANLASSVSYN